MLDLVGTDVGAKTVIERGRSGGLPPDNAYRSVVQRLSGLGRLGQKSGVGYYRYENRQPQVCEETTRLCAALATEYGIGQRRDISDSEIVERCLYPLINEGARILEEGIAMRGGDIDTVWVNGYGFPAWKGGPLYMADQIGLRQIVARLAYYAEERGDPFGYWRCSPLLARLAETDGALATYRTMD